MKATLLPRQNVRLMWFKAEQIPFQVLRKVEFSFSSYDASQATIYRTGQFQIELTDVSRQVPESQIIVFDQALGLPQFYSKTTGSVGARLATTWANESSLEIIDRLVSYIEGEESIKVEPPPPHLRERVKEIEIRERDDIVTRKIALKNLSDKLMIGVKVALTENKEVHFESARSEGYETDPPEVKWVVDVPPDSTSTIEFTLRMHVTKTFEIEKVIPPRKREQMLANQNSENL